MLFAVIGDLLVDIAVIEQHRDHGVLLGHRGTLEVFLRSFQQAKTLTQLDVLQLKIAGCRRQIMRIDRGQGVFAPIGGGTERAVELFEPLHSTAQQAMGG